ncbi:MAG TPA: FAD-dependent oxidoreductase [Bacteriovoracaceae bacterium]|nr:FAD-dependent oxidoreductase [Bacteriovoracaceae bacterium]
MTTSHWCRPHNFKSSDLSTDVLVIGGGYAGLSTAYWLTELSPGIKVTVLERKQIGAGASGRNAGFLTKGSAAFYRTLTKAWGVEKALSIFNFAEESLELVQQRVLKSSPEVKYDKTTSLTLFPDDKLTTSWKAEGFDPSLFKFNWIEQQGLPEALQKNFYGAYENTPEYRVNPMQLLGSLKKTLESRKVVIVEGVAGFQLTPEGAMTETNQIKARQVVLAMNGYLPQFHQAFKNVITPHRAQMLAVELTTPLECSSLNYDPTDRVYWRKSQDNLLLIGGKRLLDEAGELGDFERLSPVIQKGLESYLHEKLEVDFKVIHRWSGIMGFTEHELPFATKVKGPIDTYAVGGFSGHGMGFGFHAAREVAELVCGKKDDSFFNQFKQMNISL